MDSTVACQAIDAGSIPVTCLSGHGGIGRHTALRMLRELSRGSSSLPGRTYSRE